MKHYKKIPAKKQGITVKKYIKKATYKELTILFASTFWSDIELQAALASNGNYPDQVRDMLNAKIPEFLEYTAEKER